MIQTRGQLSKKVHTPILPIKKRVFNLLANMFQLISLVSGVDFNQLQGFCQLLLVYLF